MQEMLEYASWERAVAAAMEIVRLQKGSTGNASLKRLLNEAMRPRGMQSLLKRMLHSHDGKAFVEYGPMDHVHACLCHCIAAQMLTRTALVGHDAVLDQLLSVHVTTTARAWGSLPLKPTTCSSSVGTEQEKGGRSGRNCRRKAPGFLADDMLRRRRSDQSRSSMVLHSKVLGRLALAAAQVAQEGLVPVAVLRVMREKEVHPYGNSHRVLCPTEALKELQVPVLKKYAREMWVKLDAILARCVHA
jgi:hypothetical protein